MLTPMFLTAGTFFPISSFPPAIEAIARLNPLYHCVQLVRDVVVLGRRAARGPRPPRVPASRSGSALWRLAIWRMRKRLID